MGGQVLELQSEKDQRLGREQMVELTRILISQNRLADLNHALDDPDYCQQLLVEFNLLKD